MDFVNPMKSALTRLILVLIREREITQLAVPVLFKMAQSVELKCIPIPSRVFNLALYCAGMSASLADGD